VKIELQDAATKDLLALIQANKEQVSRCQRIQKIVDQVSKYPAFSLFGIAGHCEDYFLMPSSETDHIKGSRGRRSHDTITAGESLFNNTLPNDLLIFSPVNNRSAAALKVTAAASPSNRRASSHQTGLLGPRGAVILFI
jgi:hypothetical protein